MTEYVEHSNNKRALDEFHYHEIMDRIHCLHEMWNTLILEHPACEEALGCMGQDVNMMIGRCYQAAGNVNFDRKQR